MSGLQVALSLFERDMGPMPEKVSHAKNLVLNRYRKMNYTNLLVDFGVLLMHISLSLCNSSPKCNNTDVV